MELLEEKIRAFKGRRAKILDHEETAKTAVLLPLGRPSSELCVLFEKRAFSLNSQPGEICFPGGRCESSDQYAESTAIRETCEELGILPDSLEVIADLDIFVSPFNFLVIPFLAEIKNPGLIKPNPDEVEKVFWVPLRHLMDHPPIKKDLKLKVDMPDDFPSDRIPRGKDYPFRTGIVPQYFYFWEEEVIWGLTARILRHFIELLRNEITVD